VKTVGIIWRIDETYINVKSEWKYLYRGWQYNLFLVNRLIYEYLLIFWFRSKSKYL